LGNMFGERKTNVWGKDLTISVLLSNALSGNEYNQQAYSQYKNGVILLLNQALGSIDAGIWPPKEVNPVLIIKDPILLERCFDLLQAPKNYDRVIREATIILEDRIRNKVPHAILSREIPLSKEQTGERLINTLFSPKKPILLFSSDDHIHRGFYNMLIGVVSCRPSAIMGHK
jgi:hypothetical protein